MTKLTVAFRNFTDAPKDLFASGLAGGLTNQLINFRLQNVRSHRCIYTANFNRRRYEPEGRGFDSRWCHWYFSLTLSFRSHYGPAADAASNINTHQENFLGVKGVRCVGVTILPPSCAYCHTIWELNLLESSGLVQEYTRIPLPLLLLTPWCRVLL